MGLSDLRKRLTASVEDLDRDRLQDRWAGVDLTNGSPSLEVTIADGTGRAVAVFTGRKRLGGIDPGRGVVLEGIGRLERNRLVLLNPAYQLLPT